MPSVWIPSVWAPPALTACQVVAVPIWTGAVRWMLVPSPSWPDALEPQAHSVPSERIAAVCRAPALTDFQVAVPIWTGAVRLVVVPSPSWPVVLRPHVHRVPLVRIPAEW